MKRSLDAWQVPGASLAIVRGDEVVYLEGFGVRELGGDKKVTPDTVFAIASCSKAFTAAAVGVLVDEGKMTWDDPVRKHLPSFRLSDPLADSQVTVRDLLCHRTGVPRNDVLWIDSPWGRDDLLRRVAFLKPNQSFRSGYQYNNLMYLAAGQAAAAASGGRWEDLVRSRLLTPLGMTATQFSAADAQKAPDHATPHRKKDGKVEARPWQDIDNIAPAGAMVSTARDLTQWLRFQLGDGSGNGKRLLSSSAFNETHTPQVIVRLEGAEKELNPETLQKSYALGWNVQDYHGRLMWSHTGGLEGFRCRIVVMPKEKLAIALLTNSAVGTSGASMHTAATNSLVDLLLDLPKRDWNALYLDHVRKIEAADKAAEEERKNKRVRGTKPSQEPEAYAGTYEEPAYGEARLEVKDGALSLTWGRQQGTLKHFHYDTFTLASDGRLDGEQVTFQLAANGDVSALRFLGQEFRKVTRKP